MGPELVCRYLDIVFSLLYTVYTHGAQLVWIPTHRRSSSAVMKCSHNTPLLSWAGPGHWTVDLNKWNL